MDLSKIQVRCLPETIRLGKVSDEVYFSSKYSTYVSNSRLGLLDPNEDGSPEKFFKGTSSICSDSLILGSAVHTMVLQPDLFELVRTRRPNAKLGYVCDYLFDHGDDQIEQASDALDYYKGKLTESRIKAVYDAYSLYNEDRLAYTPNEKSPMFLSESMYDKAMKVISACQNNEDFNKILTAGEYHENEQCFTLDFECTFPDHEPIIISWKSKLDNYTIDPLTNTIVVNDLKTIGSILSNFDYKNNGNMKKYHYTREFAIYTAILKSYALKEFGMTNPTMRANALVVSTIPEYYTKVYKVTNGEVQIGFNEFKHLLKLVAYYKAYEGYDFV